MARSQESLISEILDLAEKLTARAKELEAISEKTLYFDDSELSVSWSGGRMKFHQDSPYAYAMLHILYDAGEEGLTHAELAESVYGDELTNFYQTAYKLGERLEKARCPIRLTWDEQTYRIIKKNEEIPKFGNLPPVSPPVFPKFGKND